MEENPINRVASEEMGEKEQIIDRRQEDEWDLSVLSAVFLSFDKQ